VSLFKFISSEEIEVPYHLTELQSFKKVLDSSNGKKYISYIYHVCDWESPYAMYPDEDKEAIVRQELDIKSIPKYVKQAVDKYEELNTTASMELLKSAQNAVRQLKKYFNDIKITEEEDKGKAAKDLMNNLKSVAAVIKSLKELEQLVKEDKERSTIRKGVEIGKFNSG
jgi:Sec-independent protein translocase protein TatA